MSNVNRCSLWLLGALGVAWAGATPEAAARGRGARAYKFDGFRLGASYHKVSFRAPYNDPCDIDPIDNRRRRAVFYGALPCRNRTFPGKTTVVLYLDPAPGRHWKQSPIGALAFLHGSYFKRRSNFPVHPGDRVRKARRLFGRSLATMTLRGKRVPSLKAHRFVGNIHILALGDRVRGVVVGRMPKDPQNEQWRAIMQMFRRYTPPSPFPPPAPTGLRGLCLRVWKRAAACRVVSRIAQRMVSDSDRFVRKCKGMLGRPRDRTVLQCMAKAACGGFDACLRR
jgi:hypothetical protein